MSESLPYNTRNRLDQNPNSFTNKQERDYADAWLKDRTVSSQMSGDAEFDSAGNRVDRRVHDTEQAMAEAYAAKPYMDIAKKYFELIKQDGGDIETATDKYLETWEGKRFFAGKEPSWVSDYDGLGALIAMGLDAAYSVSGKPESTVKVSLRQNDFLKYMSSQVDAYEKALNEPEAVSEKLYGNKVDTRAFIDSIIADLENQKVAAKSANERQVLQQKIEDVTGFGDRVIDPDSYARLHDVSGYFGGDHPGDNVIQRQRQLELLGQSGDASEMTKNRKADLLEELSKAQEAMAECTRRNKEEISARTVFEEYTANHTEPVQSAEKMTRDEEIRRHKEAIDKLFLGKKEQMGSETQKAGAAEVVPDDPLERQKFAREFFVAKNMTPENKPILIDFLKKSLIFEGEEIVTVQKRNNDISFRYPGRIQTLTGRNIDADYEKKIGVGTFLYDLLKDKIKLPSGDRYKFIDFSLVKIDEVFKGLGVDVREIIPDYDKKFTS